MIFSLPSYRRLSEVDLDRLRDEDGKPASRGARMLFNLLLLAGLWGAPLYARWALVPDRLGTQELPVAVLGTWRHDHKDVLEFTADRQLRLWREERLIETADYLILGDTLLVSDFRRQPEDRGLPVDLQRYQISIRGDQLLILPASRGFTSIPEKAGIEGSSLRFVLPPWPDASAAFRRQAKR